jgi:undecaprenyl-diphosphatase
MINLDLYFFNLINGSAGKWASLDYTGMFFAKYSEYFLWLTLILLLVFSFKKNLKMIVEALVAAGISRFVFTILIRLMWFRLRPFAVLNFVPLINKNATEASFPSGHASFYFAISTIIYLYNKKLGIFFYAVSILMGLSRIFVGVHWPLDILIGALLGILTALILNKLIKKYI